MFSKIQQNTQKLCETIQKYPVNTSNKAEVLLFIKMLVNILDRKTQNQGWTQTTPRLLKESRGMR